MYVKTVISIGLVSESEEMLSHLIDAGMDIARINFSHAKPDEARLRTERIRRLAEPKGKTVAILQDLCGPRIRVGKIEGDSREVQAGEAVTFYTIGAPDPLPSELPIRDPYLHQDVTVGNHLLIESGKYKTTITHIDVARQRITVTFENSGTIHSNKGINVPYTKLTTASPTEKDLVDIELGKALGFEYVAMSFVQSAQDVHNLRQRLNPDQKIIAKVEDPLGVANIDEIIAASDGIMVARGDLGVELPLEEIPFIQKEIVAKCRYAGKPSIVATQMLLSMVHHPSPTRAEVSDVANAVLDGADAVMLSDETAAGDYAVEAVRMLVKIADRAEHFLYDRTNPLTSSKTSAMQSFV